MELNMDTKKLKAGTEEIRTEKPNLSKSKKDSHPDIAQVINTVVDVCLGKKKPEDALKEFALEYKTEIFAFAEKQARRYLEERLRQSERKEIRALAENELSSRLIDSAAGIKSIMTSYYHNQIGLEGLIRGISESGIKQVAKEVMDTMGIAEKMGARNMEAVLLMSPQTVAYVALTAAYQELRKAYEDKQIAHEQRLQIEAECEKVVESIVRYRMEMEKTVSEYLTDHYNTFESGFAAMDQAILDNDIDGYIRGNVQIQKALGYHVQFTSQDEFDDLMMSDEAFKL